MPQKNTRAFGNRSAQQPLELLSIPRREPNAGDVEIEILYCGVCHSDIHTARNEWPGTKYPCVPGHEIVGKVTATGSNVTRFKVGDMAAVGCMVDSCRTCSSCTRDLEQFCLEGAMFTYNGQDKHLGGHTYGGYSQQIVVDEYFVLRLPENLDPAAAAPLLCAGITTYSPLRQWQAGPGKRVGVVGIGGLGHMAIKLAKAMGAEVIAFTTSEKKKQEAKRLGADEVILSTDPNQMKALSYSLDLIIDSVSATHDINIYMSMLKLDGVLVMVGMPEHSLAINPFMVAFPRRIFTGSGIGGIKETQEMLDFCGEHGITADIELIPVQEINNSYERMIKGDVRYRFVIDMESLQAG